MTNAGVVPAVHKLLVPCLPPSNSTPRMCQLLQLGVWQVVADNVSDCAAVVVCLKTATVQCLKVKGKQQTHTASTFTMAYHGERTYTLHCNNVLCVPRIQHPYW